MLVLGECVRGRKLLRGVVCGTRDLTDERSSGESEWRRLQGSQRREGIDALDRARGGRRNI